jgi:hypothetical protein
MDRFRADIKNWSIEEGFPCNHRALCYYLLDEKADWISMYCLYKKKMIEGGHRVMSDKRWYMYRKALAGNIKLFTKVEDVCDTCMRLNLLLQDKHISEDDKNEIREGLALHVKDSKAARLGYKALIRGAISAIGGSDADMTFWVDNVDEPLPAPTECNYGKLLVISLYCI